MLRTPRRGEVFFYSRTDSPWPELRGSTFWPNHILTDGVPSTEERRQQYPMSLELPLVFFRYHGMIRFVVYPGQGSARLDLFLLSFFFGVCRIESPFTLLGLQSRVVVQATQILSSLPQKRDCNSQRLNTFLGPLTGKTWLEKLRFQQPLWSLRGLGDGNRS